MIKTVLTAVFLAITITFTPLLITDDIKKGNALSLAYNGSSAYKKSIYYDNLTSLEKSGDMATDVVLTALSQVGYHEGNSTSDLNGYNQNGSKNYVEYTYLTGKLNGYQNNGYAYAWCASFVSWSLTHAGVPKTLYGGNAPGCYTLIENMQKAGAKITSPANYKPKTGDIIFFKNSTAIYSHVGIVIYSDNNYVYTVEGNASSTGYNGAGAVVKKKHAIKSTTISKYVTLKYSVNSEKKIDFSKQLVGRYFITADTLYVRSSPSGTKLGSLNKGEKVFVTDFNGDWGLIDFNGKKGYISLSYATYLHKFIPPVVENDDTVPPQTPPNDSVLPPTDDFVSVEPPPLVPDIIEQEKSNNYTTWLGIILPAVSITIATILTLKLNKRQNKRDL